MRAAVACSVAWLTVAACAGTPRHVTKASPTRKAAPTLDAGSDAGVAEDTTPTLEALARRGEADLGSMREIARVSDATRPALLPAAASDACFRAVIAASTAVRAWFEGDDRIPRGAALAADTGLVPPGGPACARRGEALRLVVEGASDAGPITARAVVFESP